MYGAAPCAVQHLLCSAEGYRIRRRRYGGVFDDVRRQTQLRSAWSSQAVIRYRDQAFDRFVADALSGSRFYRDRYRPHHLPILTRATAQAHAADIARTAVGATELVHTSGSTGSGLRFPATTDALARQWATWWRYRQWHGIDLGTWCGYFGGRSIVPVAQKKPPYWRYNVAGRQVLFSGYHLGAHTCSAYVAELRQRRLPWLHGYPSLLAVLAGYILEQGEALGYEVRWITTGAENLLPAQARLIERAFGVRPRQHYGMAEGVANASECPHGRLHVDEDFAFVEFVPTGEGTGYRVVGTNFTNRAFPLIRYDVGDIAQISGAACHCGRPGRIIDSIDGRNEDYVRLPNGALVGRLDHMFKDLVRIREAQVYQPGERRVILRVVRAADFTVRDERLLLAEAQARLGDDLLIDVEYVESIPRTASGKLRFVVSDVFARVS